MNEARYASYFFRLGVFMSGAALALFSSGCFRVALPEQFEVHENRTQSPAPSVLLVVDSKEDKAASLGHQFLFGFVPFTTLYLPKGAAAALREVWLNTLKHISTVYLTTSRQMQDAARLLRPSVVIKATISDLAVNGFDAIFYRTLSVDGQVLVEQYGKSGVVKELRLPLRIEKQARYAHAQALSELLASSLTDSALLALRQTSAARPGTQDSDREGSLVLIFPPTFVTEIQGGKVPRFSQAIARRLLQQGLADGTAAQNISHAQTSSSRRAQCSTKIMNLGTEIAHFEARTDAVQLRLIARLSACSSNEQQSIAMLVCEGLIPAPESIDSALLEAGNQAAQALFAFPNCSQQAKGALRCKCAI